MTIHDISNGLLEAPVYPGDPAPRLHRLKELENGDDCNLTALYACSHAGTHVDAPSHFIEGGSTVGELDPALFIGPCRVAAVFDPILTGAHIDALPLAGVRRLLLKGFGKSVLSRSAAYALAAEDIRLIGIDMPSIAAPGEEAEVHRALLSAGIIILEGLRLSSVQSGDYTLIAPPVLVGGAEGAFCRALLIDERE